MRTVIAGLALLTSAEALACGGLFCDAAAPVDQAAERILFAIDEDAGEVEVQVQITYQGPSEDFAWILPVPAEPELKVTVDDVFLELLNATRPQWNLTFETEGECWEPLFGQEVMMAATDDAKNDSDTGGPPSEPGVTVVSQSPVGPYDTVVLQATDADALMEWLTGNAYDLPEGTLGKVVPYVAEGAFFVALKLQKDNDAGDMVPIALTYAGTEPQIPLQLTAVAAAPDLRLQPFVLGAHRAVPENYLHVEIDELAVDWIRQGANYPDVVARAADVAGGQAFATDYADAATVLRAQFWSAGRYRTSEMAGRTGLVEVLGAMQAGGFPISTGTVPLIRRFVDIPQDILDDAGITDVTLLQCVDCWTDPARLTVLTPTLGDDLAEVLEAEWVAAMRHAQELADRAGWLTRLTSSMDADEMTQDPLFVINPDLGPVSNVHDARLVALCGDRAYSFGEAPRELRLPNGRSLILPPEALASGFDHDAWFASTGASPALSVGDAGREGPILTVRTNEVANDLLLAEFREAYGVRTCGCDASGSPQAVWLLGLGLLGLRRRRA